MSFPNVLRFISFRNRGDQSACNDSAGCSTRWHCPPPQRRRLRARPFADSPQLTNSKSANSKIAIFIGSIFFALRDKSSAVPTTCDLLHKRRAHFVVEDRYLREGIQMIPRSSLSELIFMMFLAAAVIVAITTLAAMPRAGVAAATPTDAAFRPILPLVS